jgi:hypothetical protein
MLFILAPDSCSSPAYDLPPTVSIIHHSPFIIPPASALPPPCCRIVNPKPCSTPRSILAYVSPFVKRHEVRFRQTLRQGVGCQGK